MNNTLFKKLAIGLLMLMVSGAGYPAYDRKEDAVDYSGEHLASFKFDQAASQRLKTAYSYLFPPLVVFNPDFYPRAMTAIELPLDSAWRISGYTIKHGTVITYYQLRQYPELTEGFKRQEMFALEESTPGRFLLVDQEPSWGVFKFPVDIDVTFINQNNPDHDEFITINVKRTITNLIKTGDIKLTIITNADQQNETGENYQLISEISYPDSTNFNRMPAVVLIDFKLSQPDRYNQSQTH